MRKRSSIVFSLLLILEMGLTGCGYRWQPDFPTGEKPSLSISFIPGDEEGLLTAEIARALSASGLVDVCHKGGDYRLEVTLGATQVETIGYRLDKQKIDHKVKKNLVATEARRSAHLEVSLYAGDEIAYGPFQISEAAEYDYIDGDSLQDLVFIDSSGVTVTVLPFSLGQLEPSEAAQEAVSRPLYARLAQKIADAVSSVW